jgi:molybdopterin-guanine dinucleotide biosynthesis protein A
MLKIPGMLMVGAVDGKAGKTEFACSLITRFGSQCNIIGIKVTAIEKAGGRCPRGMSDCGVCSSLEGNYSIIEETNSRAYKDTCRMLAAGASRVFWLRALKTHLEQAITELLDIIGDDAVSVCESNSLRRVVEPGLFVMVKGCGGQSSKASAKDVAKYADRIVLFDGNEFDIGADEIELTDGRWACKLQATAIIMAGGDSYRMGQDKSMLPVKTQPMIKHIVDRLRPHFNQILISSSDVSKYSFLDVEVVPDKAAAKGPLAGIASALEASANDVNFVMACDIPQVDTVLIKTMLRESKDWEAVIPRIGLSQYEPLFAVYRKGTLGAIKAALLSGNYRITDALSRCTVKYIDLTDAQRPRNLNTMKDYLEFVGRQNDDTV